MKKISYLAILSIVCFTSCSALPQLINTAEHVADDTAVSLKVSQEALRKDTNVKASVIVENSKYDIK